MYYPSLKQARAIAACGAYRKIPVSRELLSDFTTPIQALRILRARSGHCFLLESAADSGGWGRYSFLGFDPTLEVTCTDGLLTLRGEEPLRRRTAHPGQALRELLAAHKSPRLPGLPPFTGRVWRQVWAFASPSRLPAWFFTSTTDTPLGPTTTASASPRCAPTSSFTLHSTV